MTPNDSRPSRQTIIDFIDAHPQGNWDALLGLCEDFGQTLRQEGGSDAQEQAATDAIKARLGSWPPLAFELKWLMPWFAIPWGARFATSFSGFRANDIHVWNCLAHTDKPYLQRAQSDWDDVPFESADTSASRDSLERECFQRLCQASQRTQGIKSMTLRIPRDTSRDDLLAFRARYLQHPQLEELHIGASSEELAVLLDTTWPSITSATLNSSDSIPLPPRSCFPALRELALYAHWIDDAQRFLTPQRTPQIASLKLGVKGGRQADLQFLQQLDLSAIPTLRAMLVEGSGIVGRDDVRSIVELIPPQIEALTLGDIGPRGSASALLQGLCQRGPFEQLRALHLYNHSLPKRDFYDFLDQQEGVFPALTSLSLDVEALGDEDVEALHERRVFARFESLFHGNWTLTEKGARQLCLHTSHAALRRLKVSLPDVGAVDLSDLRKVYEQPEDSQLAELRGLLAMGPSDASRAQLYQWFDLRQSDEALSSLALSYAQEHLQEWHVPLPFHWKQRLNTSGAFPGLQLVNHLHIRQRKELFSWLGMQEFCNVHELRYHPAVTEDELESAADWETLSDVPCWPNLRHLRTQFAIKAPEVYDVFCSALRQSGVRALSLYRAWRKGEALFEADALCEALGTSALVAQLTRLELRSFGLGDEGFAQLCALPGWDQLEVIDICGSDLTAKAIEALARRPMPQLKMLRIGINGLGNRGLAALAESCHLPALERLSIQNNEISDISPISRARWPQLKGLHIGNNPLGATGLQTLIDSGVVASLEALDLRNCQLQTSSPWASSLGQSPEVAGLKRLTLHGNEATYEACAALANSPYLHAQGDARQKWKSADEWYAHINDASRLRGLR